MEFIFNFNNLLTRYICSVSDALLGLSRNFNLMFPNLTALSPPAAPYIYNYPLSSKTILPASGAATTAPEHECARCGRKYNHSSSLKRHMTLECGKEPRFQCPHCPHRSKLKSNLYQHIRYRHQTDSMYHQPTGVIMTPPDAIQTYDVPLNMSLPSARDKPGRPDSK